MAGSITFAGTRGGGTMAPEIATYLAANSMTGTGTPPANAVQAGDLMVLTTKSTLTSSGNTVCRMLLAADKTAVYKEGTPVAGILGVAVNSLSTNASGVAGAPPPLGAVTTNAPIPYPYSGPAMQSADTASGRSYIPVYLFGGRNIFRGRLDMAAGGITLAHQYDNTLGGFILNTSSGITTYTVDSTATGTSACLRIIGPDESDPLYNTAVAQSAAIGPAVFFEVLASFAQFLTGVDYSTQ